MGDEFFVSKWMQFFGDGWSTNIFFQPLKYGEKIGYHMNNWRNLRNLIASQMHENAPK